MAALGSHVLPEEEQTKVFNETKNLQRAWPDVLGQKFWDAMTKEEFLVALTMATRNCWA